MCRVQNNVLKLCQEVCRPSALASVAGVVPEALLGVEPGVMIVLMMQDVVRALFVDATAHERMERQTCSALLSRCADSGAQFVDAVRTVF